MRLSYSEAVVSPVKRLAVQGFEGLTGARTLRRRYAMLQARQAQGTDVWREALSLLEIKLELAGHPVDQIPREGPLLCVANHPFGLVDGVATCHILSQARSDYRVVAIDLLHQLDEIRPWVLPISFSNTRDAKLANLQSRSEAFRRLKSGGAVILFPAGEVAASPRIFGRAVESEWHGIAGRLIQATGATVLPIHFQGENSWLFSLAAQIGPSCRLALLLHETRRLIGSTIRATIGRPIPSSELESYRDRRELVSVLRARALSLATSEGTSLEPCGETVLNQPAAFAG